MNENLIEDLLPYSNKLNILYVDNDTSTEEIIHETLNKLFSKVYVAKNAKEGLASFKSNNIDIIIIDIEMAEIGGLKMSHTIKTQKSDIPIIAMSANMDQTLFIESTGIDLDAYLLKPLDINKLLITLNRIIKYITSNQNLHSDSQYFRVLTESSIVSKSDINGIITYVNDNLCNISGYSRQELLGRSHSIFRHPDNTDEMYKEMWKTILSGKVWRGRVENLNKNKNSFLADSIIIPLEDRRGKIFEFIAIRTDVTAYVTLKRKMNEDKLKEIQMQQINEAKEAFLILFTHELKTPLNAIINFSKYLHTKLTNSEVIEPAKNIKLLKSITSNANDMLDNVNNILDISKLQTQKLHYNQRLFSLNQLTISLLEQYESLLQIKKINVDFLLDEVHEIYSDEYRVKQIISNIISNAIKYGNKAINIEIKNLKTGIVFCIDDDGKGIQDKEAVFNLYEQGNKSLMTRETQGTGIGLYFVKLLCNDLNIDYAIEDSKLLSGTRFILTFNKKAKK